jgi:hypothetical protein
MSETEFQELLTREEPHEPPLPAGFAGTSLYRARRRVRTRRLARIGVSGAAVVAAAAVTALVVTTAGPAAGPTTHPGRSHQQLAAPRSDAQRLLAQVSLAADEQTVTVRDDQFIYADVLSSLTGGNKPPLVRQHDQAWVSVDGSRPGRAVGPGKDATLPVTGTPASIDSPNYRYLETLPTDPAKLIALLRGQRGMYKQSVSDDDALWMSLDGLIKSAPVMPPKLAAAVYQAAAEVPGITVVRDVTDAAGRHGVGVSYAVSFDGTRSTWIFDPKTDQYLGDRQVTQQDTEVTALLGHGVVDQVGELPK